MEGKGEVVSSGFGVDLRKIVQIDEGQIESKLSKYVLSTVEETLNAMLDAEAAELCQARKYERTSERADTRAGH